MYGTVARLKVKPGAIEAVKRLGGEQAGLGIKGYLGQYVYQMDDDPDELFLVVLFDSRENYRTNADSPEQDSRFQELMQYMAAEPEWHDGHVIFSHHV
jgi:heme-degrading monooxygenase HmoA